MKYLNDKIYTRRVSDWGLPDGSVLCQIGNNYNKRTITQATLDGMITPELAYRLVSIPEGYKLNEDGSASKIEEKPNYEWMVEYPTNGEQPDLPCGVLVKYKNMRGEWLKNDDEYDQVETWKWENSTAFMIYDERYKPVGEKHYWDGSEPLCAGMWFAIRGIQVKAQCVCGVEVAFVNESEALEIAHIGECKPIDTRTDKQKFVDEALHNLGHLDEDAVSAIEYCYDKLKGE